MKDLMVDIWGFFSSLSPIYVNCLCELFRMPVLGFLVATVLTVNIVSWLRVSQQTPSMTQSTSESIIVLLLRRGPLGGIFEAFQCSQWSSNSVTL